MKTYIKAPKKTAIQKIPKTLDEGESLVLESDEQDDLICTVYDALAGLLGCKMNMFPIGIVNSGVCNLLHTFFAEEKGGNCEQAGWACEEDEECYQTWNWAEECSGGSCKIDTEDCRNDYDMCSGSKPYCLARGGILIDEDDLGECKSCLPSTAGCRRNEECCSFWCEGSNLRGSAWGNCILG